MGNSTLVETVARAIYEAHPSAIAWEAASDAVRGWVRAQALRSIATLLGGIRDPTAAMVAAGEPVVYHCYSLEPGEGLDENPAIPTWRAMVDALREEISRC